MNKKRDPHTLQGFVRGFIDNFITSNPGVSIAALKYTKCTPEEIFLAWRETHDTEPYKSNLKQLIRNYKSEYLAKLKLKGPLIIEEKTEKEVQILSQRVETIEQAYQKLIEFKVNSQVSIDHDLIQELFDYLIKVIESGYVQIEGFSPSFKSLSDHSRDYFDWFKISVEIEILKIFHGKYIFDGGKTRKWGEIEDPPLFWNSPNGIKRIFTSVERLQIYNEILQEGKNKDKDLSLNMDLLHDDTPSIREVFNTTISTIRKMIAINNKNELGITEQFLGFIWKSQSQKYLEIFSGLEWIPLKNRYNDKNPEHIHQDPIFHEFQWGAFKLAFNLSSGHLQLSLGNFEEVNTWSSDNPNVNLQIRGEFEGFLQEIEERIKKNPIQPISH